MKQTTANDSVFIVCRDSCGCVIVVHDWSQWTAYRVIDSVNIINNEIYYYTCSL